MDYLNLNNAFIPPEFANVGHTFVNLFVQHSGITGPLPMELSCMKHIVYMHLGGNQITSIPQYALERMTSLYSLDLSYNKLTGQKGR